MSYNWNSLIIVKNYKIKELMSWSLEKSQNKKPTTPVKWNKF